MINHQITFSEKELASLKEGMKDCDLHTTSHVEPEESEESEET